MFSPTSMPAASNARSNQFGEPSPFRQAVEGKGEPSTATGDRRPLTASRPQPRSVNPSPRPADATRPSPPTPATRPNAPTPSTPTPSTRAISTKATSTPTQPPSRPLAASHPAPTPPRQSSPNTTPNRSSFNRPNARTGNRTTHTGAPGAESGERKPDHPIVFQSFFKSVGPRTYVAQVKVASNGNHYLVLTEGQRDDKTGEVRKKRINIFSEDFESFFTLLRDTAQHIRANPVPEKIRQRQAKFWKRKSKTPFRT